MISDDIGVLLEQQRRREQALLAGSTHISMAHRAPAGPLPDAVSPLDVPELLWPSERHLVPQCCTNCQASRAAFVTSAPYGLVKVGSIECFLCTRTIVRLRSDGCRDLLARLRNEGPPKRGRPPKSVPVTGACIRCGSETLSPKRQLCQACIAEKTFGAPSLRRQLVGYLADGQPRSRQGICHALGMTRDQLRKAITRAHEAGDLITTRGRYGRISLEPEP